MDFNLKQWRNASEEEQAAPKISRLLLNSLHPQPQPHPNSSPPHSSSALSLFVSEPSSILSAFSSDNSSSAKHLPSMGSHFSLAQLQELELQALIFRHMIAGTSIPSDLLHLVKKNLINSIPLPPPASSYYLSLPLHHYYPHYQPPLLQSGYWGRAAMDPEPGRCRRTDGKKWRCSRNVATGHKYCERHMHRGRNRSRKSVEISTSTPTTTIATGYGGGNGIEPIKNIFSLANKGMTASIAAGEVGGGEAAQFTLSGPSPSMDLLHLKRRPTESTVVEKGPFEAQNDGKPSGDQTLRHFFKDWPKLIHDTDHSVPSATNLSISISGNNPSSDFSLKLGTGNVEVDGPIGGVANTSSRSDTHQLNWASTWDTSRGGPMGGPLAEALRSSTSNSSPTSVLHQLTRG